MSDESVHVTLTFRGTDQIAIYDHLVTQAIAAGVSTQEYMRRRVSIGVVPR